MGDHRPTGEDRRDRVLRRIGLSIASTWSRGGGGRGGREGERGGGNQETGATARGGHPAESEQRGGGRGWKATRRGKERGTSARSVGAVRLTVVCSSHVRFPTLRRAGDRGDPATRDRGRRGRAACGRLRSDARADPGGRQRGRHYGGAHPACGPRAGSTQSTTTGQKGRGGGAPQPVEPWEWTTRKRTRGEEPAAATYRAPPRARAPDRPVTARDPAREGARPAAHVRSGGGGWSGGGGCVIGEGLGGGRVKAGPGRGGRLVKPPMTTEGRAPGGPPRRAAEGRGGEGGWGGVANGRRGSRGGPR